MPSIASRLAAAGLGAAALTAAAAAASGALVSARVARAVVTPMSRPSDDVRIHGFSDDLSHVVIEADSDTVLPGRYGLWFSGDTGFAVVGDVVAAGDGTVTRRVEEVRFGDASSALSGRMTGWVQLSPDELDVPVESVQIPTERGQAPAWLFPAADDGGTWAVHVHGRGVKRQEALRAVPVLAAAGATSLVVSWRNDGDAPASADRRYALGATEWRDLESALDWAVEHGARRLVLVGFSMGGSIVLQASVRSAHRARIAGLVLDSPVVDWLSVLEHQADVLGVPPSIRSAAFGIVTSTLSRWVTRQAQPLDFRSLDFVARAGELRVPMLVMHSEDDRVIPPDASEALAHARPDLAEYVRFTDAAHTRLVNRDPDRWREAVARFVARLPQPAAH